MISEELLNEITSSAKSQDEAVEVLKKYNKTFKHSDKNILLNFSNRNEYIAEIAETLNSASNNLIFVSGYQGTGKTALIKSVTSLLDNSCINFYYECSQITNLDDIILSLYRHLSKILAKDDEFRKNFKGTQSIDEKIINSLKSIKRPLVVNIDGVENLLGQDFSLNDDDLKQFLNFIVSVPNIKLIISGRKVPVSDINFDKEKMLHIRLSGIEETDAFKIFKDNGIQASEHTLYQSFQMTRGYAESINLLVKSINLLGISIFDMIKDYSGKNEIFEDFIYKKIYNNIPQNKRKILWMLSTLRHPIKIETIKELGFSHNAEDLLEEFVKNMLIARNGMFYYIKQEPKKIIYAGIPVNDKIKLHGYLQEQYSIQIAKKIEERLFKISRKLLHSEQYYHYLCANKHKKGSGSLEQKIKYGTMHYDPFTKQNSYRNADIDIEEVQKYDNKKTLAHDSQDFALYTPSIDFAKFADFEIEGDTPVALSDEEKKLLEENEETETQSQQEPQDKGIEELFNIIEPTYPPFEIDEDESEEEKPTPLVEAEKFKKENKLDLALSSYKKALNTIDISHDIKGYADICSEIGTILHIQKNYSQALEYLNDALNTYHQVKDQTKISITNLRIGDIQNNTYHHDEAIRHYLEVIGANSSAKNKIEAYSGLGDIYEYRGELKTALKSYNEALLIAETEQNKDILCTLYFKIALIYDDIQDTAKALKFYNKNIEINNDYNSNQYLSAAYSNIAAIYEEQNNNEQAIKNYSQSLNFDKKLNNSEDEFKTLTKIGNIYLTAKDNSKALDFYKQAFVAAKETKDAYCIAMSHMNIGDFYLELKNYEKALKAFIYARRSIGKTISTDSKEKIDRRFRLIISKIGHDKFDEIVSSLKKRDN